MSGVPHYRLKMNIMRSFPSESVVQKVVLRRRRQILYSPYDVVDGHKMIVNDVCEVIRRHPVRLDKNVIFEFFVFHGNITENHIVISRAAL